MNIQNTATTNQQLNDIQGQITGKEEELYQWMRNLTNEFDGNTPINFGHNLGFMTHVGSSVIAISFANDNTETYLGMSRKEFKEVLSQAKTKALALLSNMDLEQDLIDKVVLSTATLDSLESHQRRFIAYIPVDPENTCNENLEQTVKVLYYGVMDLSSIVGNIYAKMMMNNPTTKVTTLG